MAEPVTLTALMIAGLVGNTTHRIASIVAMESTTKLKSVLSNVEPPSNHDIIKATRKSYLCATLIACNQLVKQRYTNWEVFLYSDNLSLVKLVSYIKSEIRKVNNDEKFEIQFNDLPLLLTQFENKEINNEHKPIIHYFKSSVLKELGSVSIGRIDEELEVLIYHGLINGQNDWFDIVCAFFAEELKTNTRLYRAVNTTQILEINSWIKSSEKISVDINANLDKILKSNVNVIDQFTNLWTYLDELYNKLTGKIDESTEEIINFHKGQSNLQMTILKVTSIELGYGFGAYDLAQRNGVNLKFDGKWMASTEGLLSKLGAEKYSMDELLSINIMDSISPLINYLNVKHGEKNRVGDAIIFGIIATNFDTSLKDQSEDYFIRGKETLEAIGTNIGMPRIVLSSYFENVLKGDDSGIALSKMKESWIEFN